MTRMTTDEIIERQKPRAFGKF